METHSGCENPEQWKEVVGYGGLYEVSDQGRVRSMYRHIKTKDGVDRFIAGIEKALTKNKYGYLNVVLNKSNRKKNARVHRVVCEAFIANPEALPEVNHKNGVKTDNRLENLEWISCAGNIRHAHATGLIVIKGKYGIQSNSCKGAVFATDIKTGEVIRMAGTREIKGNGFDPAKIYRCLKGKAKKHKGYTFTREAKIKTKDQ
jgi:hypothetical protein